MLSYPPLWSAEVEARVQAEARNLDCQQRAAGPVQRCVRCVMTNQRPRIQFDAEGVCSACRYAERKQNSINWSVRRWDLDSLLDEYRGGRGYNVVVPASGGKDSSFVAWTLREMGMNPLLARWAPHMTTDLGERNWQALLHAGFDGVTAQPNGLLHRKLSRLALEFYGDPFIPFIWGQLAWPMHVALQNGVRLVFFGENGEAEYGGDPAANDRRCWDASDWDRVYMKGANFTRLTRIGRQLGALTVDEIQRAAPFYTFPHVHELVSPEFHWLGYYLEWHPQGNYYHAVDHTGFEPCETRSEGTYSRYASLDDKLDGLHYWFGYLKFGIGRCTSDAAHEVRDGELTRDEALGLIEQYDGEPPTRHINECLAYLGLSPEQLARVEDRFRA